MTDDKVLLFKLHPCSQDLSEEALVEIAEAAEIVRYESGDVICRANEAVTSVYLIVHGRLRLHLLDASGGVVMQRFQYAGGQFGGMAAALAEPTPLNCTAEDPSVLLRIDYPTAMALTKKYDVFRSNYTRLISVGIKQALFNDKAPVRPNLVAFFHESEETRVVSRQLVQRLTELGESLCVLTDRPAQIEGIRSRQVFGGQHAWTPEEVRQEVAGWVRTGRVFF